MPSAGTLLIEKDVRHLLGPVMVHSGCVLRSEDPTRNLNNEISELQARVAFPNHWSSGEHEQHIGKLRQLNFQKRLLIDYGQKQSAPIGAAITPTVALSFLRISVQPARHQ